MNPPRTFRLTLFGSPAIAADDGMALTGRATHRHRIALLALLALAPAQRMTRDKVMAYLWPESDAESARHLLKQAVYQLRQVVGDSAILSELDVLRLDPALVRADTLEFEEALARGDHARAVALHVGPLLDGFFLPRAPEFEDWAAGERTRLAAACAKALEALAVAAAGDGDHAGAAHWWRRRAAHDPYDSRVALSLMRALDAGGNRAGALQHAATHQRMLQEALGIDASPEVAALAERLRREPPPVPPVLPTPVAPAPAETASEPATLPVSLPAVVAADDGAPPIATSSPAAIVEPSVSRARRWRTAAVAVAALVLALAGVGVARVLKARDARPEPSIAVLPFASLGTGKDDEFFSDGLTEEVITRLSALPQLKVISRTSAMLYKNRDKPMRDIAAELDVANVLEGSVRRGGGRMRITAQLVDAEADRQLWAQTYDYAAGDVFRAQEEIARDVVRALELRLAGQPPARARGTRDAEAYQLYRRGRFHWETRSREGHDRAFAYYRQAIARDSGYADAYAGLADAWLTAWQFDLYDLTEDEAYTRMKWAAERAIALDDASDAAHVSFGISLWWKKNWTGAERELQRALTLNPGNVRARYWHGLLYTGQGKHDLAEREYRRAVEIDPFSVIANMNLGFWYLVTRDYPHAIEQYRRTIELRETYANAWIGLGLSCSLAGRHAEAVEAVRRGIALDSTRNDFDADLAFVLARAGDTAQARRVLREAEERPMEPFNVARAFVGLGQRDSAFAWLERSRWQWPHRANRFDPALDPVRDDPRFAQLSARIDHEMGLR